MRRGFWTGAKIFLAGGAPVFLHRGPQTHTFCNEQALLILQRDGRQKQADLLAPYLKEINAGVAWADRGGKYFMHYLNVTKGRGLGPWPNAAQKCQAYYDRACSWWRRGNPARACFFLGAAVHLVQDLCVPHHACGIAFNGHQRFEHWARVSRTRYAVEAGGVYRSVGKAGVWVRLNANTASGFYHLVKGNSETGYHAATAALLPLAQRTTAGFWAAFTEEVTR